jgi:hypothetical protein
MYPLFVECDIEGAAEVRYVHHPAEVGIDDSIVLPPNYSVAVLALGVVSEYCYRIGHLDEAIFYKNRYDTAIINLSRQLKSVNVRVRRKLC